MFIQSMKDNFHDGLSMTVMQIFHQEKLHVSHAGPSQLEET